jgi:sarcosine oxidase
MSPSLGAAAAELAWDGTTATDVSFMDPGRFLGPGRTVTSLPLTDQDAAALAGAVND